MFCRCLLALRQAFAMWLVSLSNWQFALGVWGWVSVAAVAALANGRPFAVTAKISTHDAQVINQAVAETQDNQAENRSGKSRWRGGLVRLWVCNHYFIIRSPVFTVVTH